jgi:hypothetical protein
MSYFSVCYAVTINVGRAGAANLDVIQEVEYVKQEAKIVYLLECLQKTAPPVRKSAIIDPLITLYRSAAGSCICSEKVRCRRYA